MTSPNHKERVADGAGLAFLGRLGALIEAVSVIAFSWAYGAATFGLFAVLWSYVKVSTALSDAGMTTTLQRYIPRSEEHQANQAVGHALKLSTLVAVLIALATSFAAPHLAPYLNAGEADAERMVTVIRIYVWVLPFWTFVEVGTAAIRARRTFGPEIRVRIFYEQGLRLIAAMGFAAMGMMTYGLFLAHLLSVILAALLALRLIHKSYDLRAVLRASVFDPYARDMRQFGLAIIPASLIKKLFSEFPVMYLNFLLPGAAGAAAGGYYSVARKIASALQIVRLTFEYVMAPLAAEKAGAGDHQALDDMVSFATRLSVVVAIPFFAALVVARHDILSVLRPEFIAASGAIVVLCAGRLVEAMAGPSASIVEVLGHRLLPATNGFIGMAVLLVGGYVLIPDYGVLGASLAAATGLNVTAWLAFLETRLLFNLHLYNRDFYRPVGLALVCGVVILAYDLSGADLPPPSALVAGVGGLLVALLFIIRYGLSEDDAAALGRFTTKIRKKV